MVFFELMTLCIYHLGFAVAVCAHLQLSHIPCPPPPSRLWEMGKPALQCLENTYKGCPLDTQNYSVPLTLTVQLNNRSTKHCISAATTSVVVFKLTQFQNPLKRVSEVEFCSFAADSKTLLPIQLCEKPQAQLSALLCPSVIAELMAKTWLFALVICPWNTLSLTFGAHAACLSFSS